MVQDEDERHTPPSVIDTDDHRLPTEEPRDEKTKHAIRAVAVTYPNLGRTAIFAEVRRKIPDLRQREVNWVIIKFDLPNPLR
ncbi:hypothetical protein [Micromonospora sp. MA102]|uniref:hypothetical protein n=1 Tax=Micromonospora sp. MA102 TaxID=2952755 RepID=UPI0021C5C690|nr:hypothetical protein [Micromonospora sp. MA102]